MNRIFSHGKLLLTSEYVILDGALALGVPTKLGQEMLIDENLSFCNIINWEAYHQGKKWLDIQIDYLNWKILSTNSIHNANFILEILKNIQALSSTKLQGNASYNIKTNLQFPHNFGLGSSSTLIANLAKWSEVDAFELNTMFFGGSGYDIVIAMEEHAILYQIIDNQRKITKIDFCPSFKNDLIFIYLNRKQNSREGIDLFKSKKYLEPLSQYFSELTKKVIACKDLNTFSILMNIHEEKLSQVLNIKTAKELYFSDCPYFIKSLGAWGGDFIMSFKFDGYEKYFKQKGFYSIFDWDELILNNCKV